MLLKYMHGHTTLPTVGCLCMVTPKTALLQQCEVVGYTVSLPMSAPVGCRHGAAHNIKVSEHMLLLAGTPPQQGHTSVLFSSTCWAHALQDTSEHNTTWTAAQLHKNNRVRGLAVKPAHHGKNECCVLHVMHSCHSRVLSFLYRMQLQHCTRH